MQCSLPANNHICNCRNRFVPGCHTFPEIHCHDSRSDRGREDQRGVVAVFNIRDLRCGGVRRRTGMGPGEVHHPEARGGRGHSAQPRALDVGGVPHCHRHFAKHCVDAACVRDRSGFGSKAFEAACREVELPPDLGGSGISQPCHRVSLSSARNETTNVRPKTHCIRAFEGASLRSRIGDTRVDKNGKFTEWSQKVQSALRHLFDENRQQLKSFNSVRYVPPMFLTGMPDSVFHNSFIGGMKTASGIIRSAIQEYEDYEQQAGHDVDHTSADGNSTISRKVFVVHGHDNEMKESVARFLERLDFEAVILHEQASGGDTIIEKFERNADVKYAVVLLSPDDVGAAKDKSNTPQPRARQNVVFELGYFVGKLGRSHVCPLVREPLERPSDIHGVVYIPFDEGNWKIHLVKELKNLGFEVDANKAV